METVSEQRCFGGTQGVYRHQSSATGTPMQFSVYTPPQAGDRDVPVLWYLSGLTCTEENFTVKAGAQRYAAERGMIVVAPDTSPRGAGIDGEDDDYDFGSGAGFYVNATEKPWSSHYQMYRYTMDELPEIVFANFPGAQDRQGITGHSMGGHGALVLGLRNPDRFSSVSAFSPICAPSDCPWGEKALGGYLGNDREQWKQYDANQLVSSGARSGEILIDQGDADDFLDSQLMPEKFAATCSTAGQALNLRMQVGYDHSYFFIASFIGDHINFHADRLGL